MIKYMTTKVHYIKLSVVLGLPPVYLLLEEHLGWDGSTGPFVADIAKLGSCVHDEICGDKGIIKVILNGCMDGFMEVTRKQADHIYRYYIIETGTTDHNLRTARIRYLGLRIFGWMFWKNRPSIIMKNIKWNPKEVIRVSHSSIYDENMNHCDFEYITL